MKNYILKLDYLISDTNLKNKFTLDAIEVMDYGQEVFYVLRELWCSDNLSNPDRDCTETELHL